MRKDKNRTRFNNIPNSLRKYRRARGLKQKEVAELLGLKGSSTISRWEKGAVLPKPLNIFKLAAIYRTMVDALFIDLLKAVKADIFRREDKILKSKAENEQCNQK